MSQRAPLDVQFMAVRKAIPEPRSCSRVFPREPQVLRDGNHLHHQRAAGVVDGVFFGSRVDEEVGRVC